LALCEQLHYRKGIAKALNILGDINFFLEKFDKSLEYYNRAIATAKEIDNKILIIASLVEKGEVLLATAQTELVKEVIHEADACNLSTEHHLLHFDIELLKCKLAVVEKNEALARNLLENLQPLAKTNIELAAISYIYYKLDPSDAFHQKKSIELYQNLFAQTPKYLYQLRLKKLQQ
jgi:tetratricopeptide (TPR) repeat protein